MSRACRAGLLAAVALAAASGCRRAALPPRPDGAAVVLAPTTPAGETDVPFAPEAEPNDTLGTAQRLDLAGAPARGISGSLHEGQGKARDSDLYRVDIASIATDAAAAAPVAANDGAAPGVPLPVRRLLRVDLRPEPTLAVTLEALDDQGEPLASASGGQPGDALAIPNLAVTPGPYYLRVRPAAGAGAGSYRLVAPLG